MSWQTKMAAFDLITFRLTEWFTEQNGPWEQKNDLSKLKLTKLLFFVTASTASPSNPGLLSTFDNFTAMPYGHVESTIQDHMHKSTVFNISRSGLAFTPHGHHYNPDQFEDQDLMRQIDYAVSTLKAKHPGLIVLNAFDLVDLSHRWQSWITIFSLAKRNGKLSMPIPVEMIMNEPKIFN